MAQVILQRIADGDKNAVQECLDKYSGLVWSLARRMCRNTADAEDAVQEIFIDIWRYCERVDNTQLVEEKLIGIIALRRLIKHPRQAK